MKHLLKLRYVGTDFFGFQVQPDKRTVQSVLQDAIESLYGIRYDIKGCSRTDSGVHANVYYATFDLPQNSKIVIDVSKLPLALNSVLPADISVSDATIVPDTFHVRHNVVSKEYVYLISDGKIRDPFDNNRAYCYPYKITDDMIAQMNKAGQLLSGRHDYKCFMASGSSVIDTVRNVKYIKAERCGSHVRIYACANGFLYNMVRIIAGTLLDAARGKYSADDIEKMLREGDRSLCGPTLPAHALYLNKVEFDSIYFNSEL